LTTMWMISYPDEMWDQLSSLNEMKHPEN